MPYLLKYAFKAPKTSEVQVRTSAEEQQGLQQPPQQHTTNRGEVQSDIREYKKARRLGAVEACWHLFEVRNVKLWPSVEAYSLYLPGQRVVLLQNPHAAPNLELSSPLERYFKRPQEYAGMDILTYKETFKLRKTLPQYLRAQENSIPKDQGTPCGLRHGKKSIQLWCVFDTFHLQTLSYLHFDLSYLTPIMPSHFTESYGIAFEIRPCYLDYT